MRVASAPVSFGIFELTAGDAFAAAFGWRLLRGDQPAAAAAVANRAGAHVAARLGCSIAMPTEGDLS